MSVIESKRPFDKEWTSGILTPIRQRSVLMLRVLLDDDTDELLNARLVVCKKRSDIILFESAMKVELQQLTVMFVKGVAIAVRCMKLKFNTNSFNHEKSPFQLRLTTKNGKTITTGMFYICARSPQPAISAIPGNRKMESVSATDSYLFFNAPEMLHSERYRQLLRMTVGETVSSSPLSTTSSIDTSFSVTTVPTVVATEVTNGDIPLNDVGVSEMLHDVEGQCKVETDMFKWDDWFAIYTEK
jgi:hypothetical protein